MNNLLSVLRAQPTEDKANGSVAAGPDSPHVASSTNDPLRDNNSKASGEEAQKISKPRSLPLSISFMPATVFLFSIIISESGFAFCHIVTYASDNSCGKEVSTLNSLADD